MLRLCLCICLLHLSLQGRIQPVSLGGAISVIFGSQVSVGSQVSFLIVKIHGEKRYFRGF